MQKPLTLYCQRRIACIFSDARSVVLDDQLLRSNKVLLLVLGVGMPGHDSVLHLASGYACCAVYWEKHGLLLVI
ncbi:hypothetical protein RchiOBHm_Chr2g0099511 [Rosa chinensis]|uniref:Uncharacterized protein n=1 Tax=Rosa chinensis TaxID=74649 RepID=A0A2P6RLY8_ROSCH|nr:hypothetical protein RchiOBHm_Chr2g0099511 [Rosa chinensis]